ncbi:two component transcriptional regulator, LuxR family [Andreprevotia lacus DSM 23236]|jgi:two-component system response regulator DctR|uniref:Two component transcriptional regulator, LuxR family n=1 Tax=Andreprevotia lacus DSM 23236 TaxID=1121001 RepID=A0A1W1XLE1_9NEIS|nr:response regulator [Andreprevotia lacus]SMC24725.1 two component transcriptional regulator, LuxR family [Andreprevotia lacus DSM 23236]
MRPIAIIDDDVAVRDSLSMLFETRHWPSLGFESAEDFLSAGNPADFGCLVVDIRMTGMSGLELFAELKSASYLPPVLFLTGHGDVPMAVAAIKDGAADFLEKPFDHRLLVGKVEQYLETDRIERGDWEVRQHLTERLSSLTPRERDVLRELLIGRLNKQIADVLDISIKTVEVHRARIYSKLRVRSGVELAALLRDVDWEKAGV